MVLPPQQKDQLTYGNIAQLQASLFTRDILPEETLAKDFVHPDFSGGVIDYSTTLFDQPLNDQDVIYLPMFGAGEVDTDYASRRMSEASTASNDSSFLGAGPDMDQFVNSNISDLSTQTSLTASPMTPITTMHGDGGSPSGTSAPGVLGPPRAGLGLPASHGQFTLAGGNELRRFSLPTLSHTIPPAPHVTSGSVGHSHSSGNPPAPSNAGMGQNMSAYQFPSPQPVLSAPSQDANVASPPFSMNSTTSAGFGTPAFSPSMSSSTTSSSFPVSPAFDHTTIDSGVPQGEVVGANTYVRMPNGTYRSEYVGATSIAQHQAHMYNTPTGHHWTGSVCTGDGCCSPFAAGNGTISPELISAYPHFNLLAPPMRRQRKLPKATTEYLKDWLHAHADHPYPSEDEKRRLCAATGMSMSQVSNWMINARRRILAPAKMNAHVAAATFQRQQQAAAAQQQQLRPGTRMGPGSPMDNFQIASTGYPASARPQFAYPQPTITYHNVPGQLPMSAPATTTQLSAYPFPQNGGMTTPGARSDTNPTGDANGPGTYRTAQQGTATPGC